MNKAAHCSAPRALSQCSTHSHSRSFLLILCKNLSMLMCGRSPRPLGLHADQGDRCQSSDPRRLAKDPPPPPSASVLASARLSSYRLQQRAVPNSFCRFKRHIYHFLCPESPCPKSFCMFLNISLDSSPAVCYYYYVL